jgi:ATP/maltotriose-dependent transcriptional regulator MalT
MDAALIAGTVQRTLFERARLEAATEQTDSSAKAGLLDELDTLSWRLASIEETRYCIERMLRDARGSAQEARCFTSMGFVHHTNGEFAPARSCYKESLRLAMAAGDHHIAATAQSNLGDVLLAERDFVGASIELHGAWRHAQEIDNRGVKALIVIDLADLTRQCGQLHRARRYLTYAARLTEQSASRHTAALLHVVQARMRRAQGANEAAKDIFMRVREEFEALGRAWGYYGHQLVDEIDALA